MKNVIFYFTGTGNSLDAAKRIADRIGDCELVSIAAWLDANGAKEGPASAIEAERVGFVFPLYYWGMPAILHDFLESAISFSGDPYFFCVVTKGGTPDGAALSQAEKKLGRRGIKLDAGFTVLMPDNYILLMSAPDGDKRKRILEGAHRHIDQIAAAVQQKMPTKKRTAFGAFSAALQKPVNGMFVRRVRKSDKKFTVSSACIACGKCARICSVGNIALENGKPVWNHRCEQCLGCINVCPTHAINFGKGTEKRRQYINPDLKI